MKLLLVLPRLFFFGVLIFICLFVVAIAMDCCSFASGLKTVSIENEMNLDREVKKKSRILKQAIVGDDL